MFSSMKYIRADRKPGSVLDDHPSSTRVASSVMRLTDGRVRAAPQNALFSLAPDGVYTAAVSPRAPVSSYLTISTLPRHYPFRRYVSVALSLQLPAADVIRHPCPAEPGLSSCRKARDRLVYPKFLINYSIYCCIFNHFYVKRTHKNFKLFP